jgi:hypothetical protein
VAIASPLQIEILENWNMEYPCQNTLCGLIKNVQMQGALSAPGTGRTAHGKTKITKTLSLVP